MLFEQDDWVARFGAGYGDALFNAFERGERDAAAAVMPYSPPRGVDWLSDTLHGIDIYAYGFVQRPTIYFDPNASASSFGYGTYENPFYTTAQLANAVSGVMTVPGPGTVPPCVGFQRGTTFRGYVDLTCAGTSGAPLFFCPYGDAEALPKINCGQVITDWAVENAGANIWKKTVSANSDCWENDVRLVKKTWNTNAVTTLTVAGTSTFNSNTLYIRPYDATASSPNLGQMEINGYYNYGLFTRYSDVSASGYIYIAGLHVVKAVQRNIFVAHAATIASLTTVDTVVVAGCKVGQGGVSQTPIALGVGAGVYGPLDATRLTNAMIVGNEAYDNVDNCFEGGNLDGIKVLHNYGHHGSGKGFECWVGVSNALLAYNLFAYLTTKNYSLAGNSPSGIWFSNFYDPDGSGAGVDDATYARNLANVACFNLIYGMSVAGLVCSGGNNHKFEHNTVVNDPGAVAITTGTDCSFWTAPGDGAPNGLVDISNNLFYDIREGTRFPKLILIDHALGADQGIPTGDNNIYFDLWGSPNAVWAYGAGPAVETANFTTYKAAMAPYSMDQNSIAATGHTGGTLTAGALNLDLTTWKPGAGSAALLAGLTSLTGIGLRYQDGVPYVAATCSIGAFLGG